MESYARLFVATIAICNSALAVTPKYNYHYKSDESLKTAASSSVPYTNSYEIEEDGYFPEFTGGRYEEFHNGYRPRHPEFQTMRGFDGYDRFPGYIGNVYQPRMYPRYYRPHPVGVYVNKNHYEAAKKNVDDENSERVDAKSGHSANRDSHGYDQGSVAQKSSKGDSGYYKDESANKNQAGDGKSYVEVSNHGKAGKIGDSENNQKSHKKGHVTKGFKTSHRKDEEEKTETFYDEAHDEGSHRNFGHNQGSFDEKSQSSAKAGSEHETVDIKSLGKEGHYDASSKSDDARAKKGEFGQSEYKDNSEHVHKLNDLGQQSILGQQETSGEYYNKPYGVLPIYE